MMFELKIFWKDVWLIWKCYVGWKVEKMFSYKGLRKVQNTRIKEIVGS